VCECGLCGVLCVCVWCVWCVQREGQLNRVWTSGCVSVWVCGVCVCGVCVCV